MIMSVLQHRNEANTAPVLVWETLSSFVFRKDRHLRNIKPAI